jgi:hypothetical protein
LPVAGESSLNSPFRPLRWARRTGLRRQTRLPVTTIFGEVRV